MDNTLSADLLQRMDAYWRAANYLSVGQVYLYDNPLLKRPLKLEDVKHMLLGHWGTTPGQNFVYVHLNRIIKKYDHVMNKKAEVVRVYLPPDANCLLSVMDNCHYVNVVVAGKHPAPQWLTMDAAVKHCTEGISIWQWASNDQGAISWSPM